MSDNFTQVYLEVYSLDSVSLEDYLTASGASIILESGSLISPNFVVNEKGWRITSDGDAQFKSIKITGGEVPWSTITDDDGNQPDDNADVTADNPQVIDWLESGNFTSKLITLVLDPGQGDVAIKAGKTDFGDDTAGFILGIDDSDDDKAKLEMGDADNNISWNGSLLTVNGAVVDTPVITNLQEGSEISIQGWSNDIEFSSTDYNTVAWASGTITLLDGTTYSITGGNTGDISALTYIYLDINVSTTVLQTSTTATDAVGAGKILVAVAKNNTDTSSKATFQAFGGQGGQQLAVDNISANSASTNEFVANTANIKDAIISNAKITDLSVDKLTSGSITSKVITLTVAPATGDAKIQAGKTDFDNTESGFILGIDDSDSDKAKFIIGDSQYYINWNGEILDIVGTPKFKSIFTARENISANDLVSIRDDYKGGSSSGAATVDECVYVREQNPTTNYKSDTHLWCGRGASTSDDYETLIKLDKAIAGDGFTLDLVNRASQAETFSVWSNTSSWDENSVTWNTKPSKGRQIGTFTCSGNDGDTDTMTITGLSGEDVDNINNYGITIYNEEVGITLCQFYSDNYGSNEPESNVETGGTRKSWAVQADASNDDYRANSIIGFAVDAISEDNVGVVQIGGIADGFSGLLVGTTYYLSDTAGAISTSAGSQSRKIGIAISTTEILIIRDNV